MVGLGWGWGVGVGGGGWGGVVGVDVGGGVSRLVWRCRDRCKVSGERVGGMPGRMGSGVIEWGTVVGRRRRRNLCSRVCGTCGLGAVTFS